jgi:uncharacterized membrane protein YkvA (DUF1232 family)
MEKQYSKYFNDQDFFKKIRKIMGKVPFIKEAVMLYYVLKDTETPLWIKAKIAFVLGYFIFPFDAIPDFLPIGYTDDATLILTTFATLSMHIKNKHIKQANDFFND